MANSCFYRMKVVGESRENLEKFFRAMNWDGEYEECGVGRIYSCYKIEEIEQRQSDNRYSMVVEGDCAWSILSSMIQGVFRDFPNGLPAQSKNLNLDIEAYSEECGFEFQEHFIYKKGEEIVAECVDWYEIFTGDCTGKEIEEMIEEKDLGRYITGDYREYIIDDYMCFGGFEKWSFGI